MDTSIKIINQQEVLGKNFTVYGTFDNPLFLAKDVAGWIEHSDASTMAKAVDEEERLTQTLFVSGQNRDCLFLTEEGLYEVLMQSRKPIAKAFKKKVKVILKELRTKGITAAPATIDAIIADPEFGIKLLSSLKEERIKRAEAEKQLVVAKQIAQEKTIQLDENKEWYTIKRFAKENRLDWRSISWQALKALSHEHGYMVKKIFDANYGEVNIYHKNVFGILYGVAV